MVAKSVSWLVAPSQEAPGLFHIIAFQAFHKLWNIWSETCEMVVFFLKCSSFSAPFPLLARVCLGNFEVWGYFFGLLRLLPPYIGAFWFLPCLLTSPVFPSPFLLKILIVNCRAPSYLETRYSPFCCWLFFWSFFQPLCISNPLPSHCNFTFQVPPERHFRVALSGKFSDICQRNHMVLYKLRESIEKEKTARKWAGFHL